MATRKIDWQSFGGPCHYGRTGTRRITYWVRLGTEVHKVTPATPSAYGDLGRGWNARLSCPGYERHCFGSAALGEV